MKKFIRFSAAAFCAVLVSASAVLGVSAADCDTVLPGCVNQGNCVVSLNSCNSAEIQNILSDCRNGNCNVQDILSACQNGNCNVGSLVSDYGCNTEAVQKLISQCGVLPDNAQCTDCGTDTYTTVTDPTPVPQQTTQTDTSVGYPVNDYEQEVVRLVNEIRQQNGLNTLSVNTELSKVAGIKAQDMHDNRYFSHTSPTYGSPFDMMKQFGISYRTAGENIAMGQQTPQAVVDAWMNSDGHRANILNASYTQIGMGYVADGNYWSQMFIG